MNASQPLSSAAISRKQTAIDPADGRFAEVKTEILAERSQTRLGPFSGLNSTEDLLQSLKGRIAVVGNATPSRPLGRLIDAYDTVIRMNNFRTEGFENLVGSRTDLRCTTGWSDIEHRRGLCEFSPFTEQAPESSCLAEFNRANHHPVLAARTDIHRFIPETPKPSAGFALVQLAAQLGIPLNLFCFDGFKSPHYWNPGSPVVTTHSLRELDHILTRPNILLYGETYPYRALYDYCHVAHADYDQNVGLDVFRRLNLTVTGKSILEYGAGNGALADHLEKQGNRVTAVEISQPAFDRITCSNKIQGDALSVALIEDHFDLLVSVDVLEHLTENDIRLLIREAARLCDGILLTVSTRPSGLLGPNGENLHLTVRPPEWWLAQFAPYFQVSARPCFGDRQFIVEGVVRKGAGQPGEAMPRTDSSLAAVNADLSLGPAYKSRLRPEYFEDTVTCTTGVVWQPDVYPIAASLARTLGSFHLIDIGCGYADKLAALHPEFLVTGVDYGKNIRHCRGTYDFGQWLEADLESTEDLPLPRALIERSVVICSDVIEHLVGPSVLLRLLKSLLRHAPVVVLSTPERDLTHGVNHAGPPPNPAHTREWNLAELAALLTASGLRIDFIGLTRSNNQTNELRTQIALITDLGRTTTLLPGTPHGAALQLVEGSVVAIPSPLASRFSAATPALALGNSPEPAQPPPSFEAGATQGSPALRAEVEALFALSIVQAEDALQNKDYRAARDALDEALQVRPNQPELLVSRGFVCFQLQDFVAAHQSLARVVAMHPEHEVGHANLAALLVHLNRADEAEAVLRRALLALPGSADLFKQLAAILLQAERFQEAAEAYGKALGQKPEDVTALLGAAKCRFETGDLDSAQAACEQALRLEPENSVARESLAIIHAEKTARRGEPGHSGGRNPPGGLRELRQTTGRNPRALSVPRALSASDQEKLDRIACPFCGSEQAYAFRQAADIVECANCATVYLRTRSNAKILEEIYQTYVDEGSHMRLPKSLGEAARSGMKRDNFLQEVLQFTPPEGKLLDVGCSWGAFLLNARNHGFEPSGVELTRKAVRYANEELHISVVNTQFLDTPYEPNSLQAVTMIHVFEHLPQPKEALEKVFRCLKPGGVFCGIVPNIDSFCSRAEGEKWYWLDPNYHYVHYTPTTIRRHMEAMGFKIERIYTTYGDYGKAAVRKVAVMAHPELQDDTAFDAWIQRIEAEGLGEEIRFFVRKPLLVNNEASNSSAPDASATINLPNGTECLVSNRDRQITASLSEASKAIEALDWPVARGLYRKAKARADHSAVLADALEQAVARLDDLSLRSNRPDPADKPVSPDGFSFCIITNGKRPAKLRREIDSIRALGIAHYEILVGGVVPDGLEGVRVVPVPDAARCGRLGEMRNRLTEQARFEHLVVADDDVIFLPDFHEGLTRFGEDYEVQCVRLLNPDGTRYWDWATSGGPRGHRLLAYDETDPFVYVTGGLCIMKARVAGRVKWDEGRGFYEGEDADFSTRLHAANISIKFNPHCAVVHHDARLTQFGEIVVTVEGLRQTANDYLRGSQWVEAEQAFARLRLLAPETVPTYRQLRLDRFVARREGRYVYFRENLFPVLQKQEPGAKLVEIGGDLEQVLRSIGPFYAHFGGVGDALLLLATFLEKNPAAQVVSFPNSIGSARSFFDAFPSLTRVLFLPKHSEDLMHLLLRRLMHRLPNCQGVGVTPETNYFREWHEGLDIFRQFQVVPRPDWAKRFATAPRPKQVVLAPRGSMVGMVGTKRNIIGKAVWPELIRLVCDRGFVPVIIGTPDERADYPCLAGCDDSRSYSFREQMEHIANSAAFVGADSWAKTFSALAGIPTIVFEPLKEADWIGQKDASDFVFIDPWDLIVMVKNLAHFREVFGHVVETLPTLGDGWQKLHLPAACKSNQLNVTWEGSFHGAGSLSHVNRELAVELGRQQAVNLTSVATTNTQITIRHSWPPNWSPPERGGLVLIQPWEFGMLPAEWVRRAPIVQEFWVPSEYVRAVYVNSGVPAGKVRVVPNGINPEKFHAGVVPLRLATTKSFKFLFVGGTIHRKGPDVLLDAYLKAFAAKDDVCLVIKDFGGKSVYAGQTMETRIKAAQSVSDAPEILYLNEELPPDSLPALYAACDCLVHPYRGEGFGLPILEAMACGLPVIATAGGGADDFATDEFTYRIKAVKRLIGASVGGMKLAGEGWLLEPDVTELERRMDWVMAHRDEARALGARAAAYVRRDWTWERAAVVAGARLEQLMAQQAAEAQKANEARSVPAAAAVSSVAVGLSAARELFLQRKFPASWKATCAAIKSRSFHPEAYLLLAEIAQAAGDGASAQRCVQYVQKTAPKFRPNDPLLKSKFRGGTRPEWLVLPSSIEPTGLENGPAGSRAADSRQLAEPVVRN